MMTRERWRKERRLRVCDPIRVVIFMLLINGGFCVWRDQVEPVYVRQTASNRLPDAPFRRVDAH